MSVFNTGTTSKSPSTPAGHGCGCSVQLPGDIWSKMSTTMLGDSFNGFSFLLFPMLSICFLKLIMMPQSNSSSSCFTCTNVKQKNSHYLHKYMNVSVLSGCETWCKTIREEQRLQMSEIKVLSWMFGPKDRENYIRMSYIIYILHPISLKSW